MIRFHHIQYKNLLATGNAWTKIHLDSHPHTLIVGQNGVGKCVCPNTRIKVRNRHTGEIRELTVGEFFAHAQQDTTGQNQ